MRAIIALLGACAVLAAGCGSQATVSVPSREEAQDALAGAPAPLAALHRQGGTLLNGGETAFTQRVGELRGRPIVVNAWGSWCAPCRQEFPYFQRAAVAHGKRVAFLGLDVRDPRDDARAFLAEHWVAYPSYVDQDEDIAHAIGVTIGLPTTVFYDPTGRVAYVHQGPYRDEADLVGDIRRYALGT